MPWAVGAAIHETGIGDFSEYLSLCGSIKPRVCGEPGIQIEEGRASCQEWGEMSAARVLGGSCGISPGPGLTAMALARPASIRFSL